MINILFKKLNIEEQIHLKHLWEKYEAGSFEHGLDLKSGNCRNLESRRMYFI